MISNSLKTAQITIARTYTQLHSYGNALAVP